MSNDRIWLSFYSNSNSNNSQQPKTSAGLMPTEARGNYLPEPPYLRETKTYHSQPLESTRHARNYFVPLSIRPIFIFCCRSYVKLLDYWRAEKNFTIYFRRPPLRPEARGICHICHMVNPAVPTNDKSLYSAIVRHTSRQLLTKYGKSETLATPSRECTLI